MYANNSDINDNRSYKYMMIIIIMIKQYNIINMIIPIRRLYYNTLYYINLYCDMT